MSCIQKKNYTKMAVTIEVFALNEAIAANCGYQLMGNYLCEDCYYMQPSMEHHYAYYTLPGTDRVAGVALGDAPYNDRTGGSSCYNPGLGRPIKAGDAIFAVDPGGEIFKGSGSPRDPYRVNIMPDAVPAESAQEAFAAAVAAGQLPNTIVYAQSS